MKKMALPGYDCQFRKTIFFHVKGICFASDQRKVKHDKMSNPRTNLVKRRYASTVAIPQIILFSTLSWSLRIVLPHMYGQNLSILQQKPMCNLPIIMISWLTLSPRDGWDKKARQATKNVGGDI